MASSAFRLNWPRLEPGDDLDLASLLDPASAFAHPDEVVRDPDLTINEKRAILSSWASDVCAVEANPTWRSGPGGSRATFDEIMDALRSLDREAERLPIRMAAPYRAVLKKRGRGSSGESGAPL